MNIEGSLVKSGSYSLTIGEFKEDRCMERRRRR